MILSRPLRGDGFPQAISKTEGDPDVPRFQGNSNIPHAPAATGIGTRRGNSATAIDGERAL